MGRTCAERCHWARECLRVAHGMALLWGVLTGSGVVAGCRVRGRLRADPPPQGAARIRRRRSGVRVGRAHSSLTWRPEPERWIAWFAGFMTPLLPTMLVLHSELIPPEQ